jgi:hypothetical protein
MPEPKMTARRKIGYDGIITGSAYRRVLKEDDYCNVSDRPLRLSTLVPQMTYV